MFIIIIIIMIIIIIINSKIWLPSNQGNIKIFFHKLIKFNDHHQWSNIISIMVVTRTF